MNKFLFFSDGRPGLLFNLFALFVDLMLFSLWLDMNYAFTCSLILAVRDKMTWAAVSDILCLLFQTKVLSIVF